MTPAIKQHVSEYNRSKGWGTEDSDLIATITDSYEIWDDPNVDSHRWWDNFFRVVDVNGMKIGFLWASTTGDDSAKDKGWEFDPSTICEVEEKTETRVITTYVPKKT
jgi:hypothetical protein